MAKTISLSDIDTDVQRALRNTVGSPLDQTTRVRAYNRTIDFLQGKYDWNTTKKVKQFTYFQGEVDYSIENTLGVTDFKGYWDMREIDNNLPSHDKQFEDIDERLFSTWLGQNRFNRAITIEERSNDGILRILPWSSNGRTVIHQMDSLTADGTWASDTTDSDATTLAVDSVTKKEGSASLKFNIDVSQSANDYAQVSTTTVLTNGVDATNLEDVGHFRFWLGLHNMSAANITDIVNNGSIELRWGSSSSAYWSATTTTAINNGELVAGWNRVDFDWANATETGSPDVTDLDYFAVIVNYSSAQTDSNNIRVDDIVMLQPLDMELVYFSSNMVDTDDSGTADADHFTISTIDGTEDLMWHTQHYNCFIDLALEILFPQQKRQTEDFARVAARAEEELNNALNEFGNERVRERYNLRVHGNSTGRVESRQW